MISAQKLVVHLILKIGDILFRNSWFKDNPHVLAAVPAVQVICYGTLERFHSCASFLPFYQLARNLASRLPSFALPQPSNPLLIHQGERSSCWQKVSQTCYRACHDISQASDPGRASSKATSGQQAVAGKWGGVFLGGGGWNVGGSGPGWGGIK